MDNISVIHRRHAMQLSFPFTHTTQSTTKILPTSTDTIML